LHATSILFVHFTTVYF